MKVYKDLEFEKIYFSPDIIKYVASIEFENNYSVRVYKQEYMNAMKRSFEVYAICNGEPCKDIKINKMAFNISESDITEFMKMVQGLSKPKFSALSAWENIQIERADKTKPVKFNYRVVDCEHDGDMNYAKLECCKFCEQHGGKVVREYWDGEDCGEAYITCEFPFDKVEEIFLAGFFEHDFYQY